MLHFVSALSGEDIAALNTEDVDGKPARVLKEHLASITGVTRFRQRLILEDGSRIDGDELYLSPQKVQVVLLQFLPPDVDAEEKLLAACREDDVQELQRWLEEPRDPNSLFEFLDVWSGTGTCSLHCAASFGSVQCLRLLLEAGGDKDAPCNAGFTPLTTAANRGQLEAVCFLIENAADKNIAAKKWHNTIVCSSLTRPH